MNEEYISVLCASLLHDIGKFLQRGYDRQAPHYEMSELFVQENAGSFHDAELVRCLVGHHHEAQYVPESARPGSIADERRRMLAYLVSAADSQSAAERSQSASGSGYQPFVPMDSVFSQVNLGAGVADRQHHRLSVLFSGDVFPHSAGDEDRYDEQEYQEHVHRFLLEFREQFAAPYEHMADTLMHLLQKYLWCIPSDTTVEDRDISLADHMKVSCALAACFYRWHEVNGWTEQSVRNSKIAKSYLLCGDISGIQNFIYSIAEVGTSGVARRLRGRSYRISMLTDLIAIRILRELDLPLACRIMSAGGQFYLLIPNTDKEKATAAEAVRRISDWLLRTFNGEIAISVGGCEITGEDLSQSRFDEVLSRVRSELSLAKQRKFADILGSDRVVLPLDYHGRRACSICGKRPADLSPEEGTAECEYCRADRELGRALVSDTAWLVVSDTQTAQAEPVFDDPTWFVSIVTEEARIRSLSPILVFDLRGPSLVRGVASGYQLHAGYVPRSGDGSVKTFECIANASEGVKLLGVLRADVDHLGLIFTLGMRNRASLSRIATMSSMLHYFFAYELPRLLAREFPDTYTAYAGGDDLMLIGPWNQTILLSQRISAEFRKFTAENPNITLSAAIGTYKQKSPIATASRQTGELLERSKAAGRNRLTVFDTTIEWSDFDTAREWKQSLLDASCDSDHALSSGFVYRLLGYRGQAMRYFAEKAAREVMYRPHLAYDIARNLLDKDGDPRIDTGLFDKLCGLVNADVQRWSLLGLAIPWYIYLTRRGEADV